MSEQDARGDPEQDPPRAGSRAAAAPACPSLFELALAFAKVSFVGFGGILPWWRRMFVEDKQWLTTEEFNKLFAMCQFLPGPNVVNMAAVYGLRLHGAVGAVAAVLALCAPPVALMIGAGMLYARYGGAPGISGALAGLAAAVAGLMIATAVRMAEPLVRRRIGPEPLVAIATFVAVGLFRLPLFPVLVVLAPVSIALAWWVRR